MILRWLLIALIIYMIYRLIARPKKRQKHPFFTFHFGHFDNRSGSDSPNSNSGSGSGNKKLDSIEEAEFEDITDKDATS